MPELKKTVSVMVTVAAIILMAALPFPAAADQNFSISFKGRAEVNGSQITLKDIAYVTGPDGALKRDLEHLVITKAPKPGRAIKIRKQYINHKLKNSALPLEMVKWTSPEVIMVTRGSQTVKESLLKKIFIGRIKSLEPYKSSEWELVNIKATRVNPMPKGRLTYKTEDLTGGNHAHKRVSVRFFVDDSLAGKTTITGRLKVFGLAVVAVKRIEKGAVISKKDVKLARLNVSKIKDGAALSLSQVIGMTGRHKIDPGRLIRTSDISKTEVVHKGDTVTILAETGNLRVTARGLARESGSLGEKISILNIKSKKTVLATVVSSTLVRIDL